MTFDIDVWIIVVFLVLVYSNYCGTTVLDSLTDGVLLSGEKTSLRLFYLIFSSVCAAAMSFFTHTRCC